MDELPEYMMRRGRDPDQVFTADEHLYRRVPHDLWDEDEIELDIIDFPDMSVTREKYGPPTSVRWVGETTYVDWGVIGFQVRDIPQEIRFQGAFIYRMRPSHEPLKYNYPHSEVQIFESRWEQLNIELHLDRKTIVGVPPEAQLEWRELLRRRCQIVLRPREEPENNS